VILVGVAGDRLRGQGADVRAPGGVVARAAVGVRKHLVRLAELLRVHSLGVGHRLVEVEPAVVRGADLVLRGGRLDAE
jgi:hypothetical protein